jgi:hypothetical protein
MEWDRRTGKISLASDVVLFCIAEANRAELRYGKRRPGMPTGIVRMERRR